VGQSMAPYRHRKPYMTSNVRSVTVRWSWKTRSRTTPELSERQELDSRNYEVACQSALGELDPRFRRRRVLAAIAKMHAAR
jgi:hypothetical protein